MAAPAAFVVFTGALCKFAETVSRIFNMGGGMSKGEVQALLNAQANMMREEHKRNMQELQHTLEKMQELTRNEYEKRLQEAVGEEREKVRQEMERTMGEMEQHHKQAISEAKKKHGEKMREMYAEKGTEMRYAARCGLGVDETKRNVAITGQSGAGKSALINGLRQISKKGDPFFAQEGITELDRTKDTKYYEVKGLNMYLWDMAGQSQEHPSETYFWDKFIFAFDYIMIVIKNSISEVDVEIARNAQYCRIPYSFVRSKSDHDIDSEMGEEITDIGKQLLRSKVELDLKIKSAHLPEIRNAHLFFVSSKVLKTPDKYKELSIDENALLEHIRCQT